MKQTFVVTATPRERFRLSQLLMSDRLKFRRKSLAQLRRARAALGLVGCTEVGIFHKRVAEDYARNQSLRHRFTVTAETAEFLLEQIDQVELAAFDAHALAGLVAQLERGEDAEDAAAAAELDEADELARWRPDPRPLMDDPAHFLDAFGELLRRADGDLRKLAQLYAEAMRPDSGDDGGPG